MRTPGWNEHTTKQTRRTPLSRFHESIFFRFFRRDAGESVYVFAKAAIALKSFKAQEFHLGSDVAISDSFFAK